MNITVVFSNTVNENVDMDKPGDVGRIKITHQRSNKSSKMLYRVSDIAVDDTDVHCTGL